VESDDISTASRQAALRAQLHDGTSVQLPELSPELQAGAVFLANPVEFEADFIHRLLQ
jgi:hypothetical protein